MGGRSSKNSIPHNRFSNSNGRVDYYGSGRSEYQPNGVKSNSENEIKSNLLSNSTPLQVHDSSVEKPLKESSSFHEKGSDGYRSNEDDFYDGIPRFPRSLSQKSRSMRSKQAKAAKVSEGSSRLGKARNRGLGKAVEVLDTLGSSMTSLNPSSGFVSGSLSKRSMRQLKEVVLTSEGVQQLVSNDINELLTIFATDKREELKIFSGEVVRFGNRCKDPQWHNLDLYFEKRSKQRAPHNQLREEADQMIQKLMTLVQYTAELYQELQALDRFFEQDSQLKRQEDDNPYSTQRGDNLAILRADLKSQRKLLKSLKKKSLWSRTLEEVMEKLVDIVLFLNREMHNIFGNADGDKPSEGSLANQQRLGSAGLSLHYANIVIQIDTIVARCSSMPSHLRETLYKNLPPSMRSTLRSKLQSSHVKEGLTVTEIKDEMEKTLSWLVPTAINTAKDHHGFGWVGEWANTGSESNRKPAGPIEVIRIETFHHADRERTEACILELLVWLNHLIKESKVSANGSEKRLPIKASSDTSFKETNQHSEQLANSASSSKQSIEDQEMVLDTIESGEKD
ncbi:uncharacterized protein LOC114317291 isoform X2 [Camellia sinensis]|uniref:uncharacterized protein LOC114317291 isoform X2 n=1 Tax=Camellia sinensis TaxID=4442 RepID=UPI001036D495|nr:uncharacterized protein LOC114317291 isoform X2 [Camellia sinensis]